MKDLRKHWSSRLRNILRKSLVQEGIDKVPSDITIKYVCPRYDDIPCIEIRHNPDQTERSSVHDYVSNFSGDDESISRFLDKAKAHVRKIIRRDIRTKSLKDAGYNPFKPPMHFIETHPLVALSFQLKNDGKAGIGGDFYIENGLLLTMDMMIVTMPNAWYGIEVKNKSILTLAQQIPDVIINTLPGKPLHSLVQMPECSCEKINLAVQSLTIDKAVSKGEYTDVIIKKADAIALQKSPDHVDDSWKSIMPFKKI